MMRDRDIANLSRIYKLLLKSNMERVFLKEFQNYIQAEGEVILGKVNAEEERAMKSIYTSIKSKQLLVYLGKSSVSIQRWKESEKKLAKDKLNSKRHKTWASKDSAMQVIEYATTSLTTLILC